MDATEELTTESEVVGGTVLNFPANDSNTISSSSPPRIPRRLRRRLAEYKSPSTSVEEIEAKLKDADLRRQQFYELLSSKARLKPRSLAWSSSQEEDLGQRLNAKLNAAEQKRFSILANVQKRLARLDELRQASKSGLETRFENERDKLGMKVESRVQQAEVNRMLLLKAHRQERVAKKERTAQLLMRKLNQENRYKQCVEGAILQKRAAAEKRRLGLLEAEKSRARARALRVRQIASSVYSQREIERRRLKDQLEDRLQRAKTLRAEYLRKRGSLHSSTREGSKLMGDQGELLSRKLAKCWRQFVKLRRTTFALTQAYVDLKINVKSMKLMPFEQLALQIESASTIQTVKALLDRLGSRITLTQAATGNSNLSSLENIDHLLKRVASPSRRHKTTNATRNRGVRNVMSRREVVRSQIKLSRYPVRIVLCAYMILGHPDAVLHGKGDCEITLAESAETFIRDFELLIKIIIDGPIQTPQEESASSAPTRLTFRSQLKAFDKTWCTYLYRFVMWKVKDAKLLEEDLVRAACQLELSIMQSCNQNTKGDYGDFTPDMKVFRKQAIKDQELLREQVQHLSGSAGLERMECAVSDMRSKFLEAKEALASPLTLMSSPSSPSSSSGSAINDSRERNDLAEGHHRSRDVGHSLFKADEFSLGNEVGSSSLGSSTAGHLSSCTELVTENEMLVNEIVHEHRHGFANGLDFSNEDQDGIKAKVRETMEKAFWNGIMESMKQDEPEFSWVLKLMKEVQDELCKMSPSSWRQEIVETIDIDLLSQVLKSGTFDMDYLGRILEFALFTLQKLSAPAKEDEMKTSYHKLLKELGEISQDGDKSNGSFALLMIKGLRFVLQQTQTLKYEISKTRIRTLEQLIKGPAGLEYLRKVFASRYGSHTDVPASLPLTMRWLSALKVDSVQEWDEYIDSLSVLQMSNVGISPTTLRTGGSIPMATVGAPTSIATGTEQPECKGERIDLLLRLGLLKLVSEVEGLTVETLPETLKLNLSRLRSVQSQLQKIIVVCTSILVLRQVLLSENLVTSPIEMENVVSQCVTQLFDLLDSVEDVGISEIVETMGVFAEKCDPEKLQASKEVMANMLAKSLRDGDEIFTRVSRTVYLAASRIVLGGSGVKGRQLAEIALRRVGAALLTEKLTEAVEVVVVVATVSGSVHGAWYEQVLKSL